MAHMVPMDVSLTRFPYQGTQLTLQQNIKITHQHPQPRLAPPLVLLLPAMALMAVRYSSHCLLSSLTDQNPAYGSYKEKREAAPEPEAAPADYGAYGAYGSYGRTSQLYPPIEALSDT